jgi:hypothetical protein
MGNGTRSSAIQIRQFVRFCRPGLRTNGQIGFADSTSLMLQTVRPTYAGAKMTKDGIIAEDE